MLPLHRVCAYQSSRNSCCKMRRDRTSAPIADVVFVCVQPLYIYRQWVCQNWGLHMAHPRVNIQHPCRLDMALLWVHRMQFADSVSSDGSAVQVIGLAANPGSYAQSFVLC